MASPRIFEQTAGELSRLSAMHSAALVAFSTGKDSLVVLDLCVRNFKRVVPFFMYLTRGLEIIESRIRQAESRWGVEVLQVPHWGLPNDMGQGIYCPKRPGFEGMKGYNAAHVYEDVRRQTGIDLVLTGDKKRDFVSRRAAIRTNKDPYLAFPIADWSNAEVMAYLSHQKIALPDSPGDATGIDLTTKSLLWLHDHHRTDFDLLCRDFPFAPAVVARREYYGVGR